MNEANNNELVHVQIANHNHIDDNNGDYEQDNSQNGLGTTEMKETKAPSSGTNDRNAEYEEYQITGSFFKPSVYYRVNLNN